MKKMSEEKNLIFKSQKSCMYTLKFLIAISTHSRNQRQYDFHFEDKLNFSLHIYF